MQPPQNRQTPYLLLVPRSCISFCTFSHSREPKMADIVHKYYGSLRLACQGRWAAAPKLFNSSQFPILSLNTISTGSLYSCTLTTLYTPSTYLLSQSRHCLSSTGKRSILLSCTTLFCMSLPLLYDYSVPVAMAQTMTKRRPYVKNSINIRMGTRGERWRNPINW